MGKIKLTERLLGLFALGWLLLSFPLFSIWDRDALVLGMQGHAHGAQAGMGAVVAVVVVRGAHSV